MAVNNAVALAASTYTPDTILTLGEGFRISVLGICVVMFELALLAVFILLMAKVFKIVAKSGKKKEDISEEPVKETPAGVSPGTPLPETDSAGKIDLVNVDEATAAVIMAIVSNRSGIPLNRLSFKSIKLLEDEKQ